MKIHEQITEETWCQGKYMVDENGREVLDWEDANRAKKCCPVGWIKRTYHNTMPTHRVEKESPEAISLMAIIKKDSIAYWNDDPLRTFSDVLEAFKKANL